MTIPGCGYSSGVLLDDTLDVLRAARALDVDPGEPLEPTGRAGADPAVLRDALDRAWREVARALRAPDAHAGSAADLVAVLERIGVLRERAHGEDVARRDRRLRGVRDALAELRHATELAALERDAAAAVNRLGFDRGIVSRLEDGVWTPHEVVVERDPVWAADILGVAQASPRRLTHELPEATLVRRGGSILVDRVQERDDVYLEVARSSRSPVYAATPIPGRDGPLGFVHGDRYFHGDAPAAADRLALETFAEGLGQAVVRLRTLDRVRDLLDRTVGTAAGAPSPSGAPSPGSAPSPRPGALGRLTARECEVLAAVAAGGTNYSIARRLSVSESTVKTHVKNILRKLEVANRAQAVTRWWETGGPG